MEGPLPTETSSAQEKNSPTDASDAFLKKHLEISKRNLFKIVGMTVGSGLLLGGGLLLLGGSSNDVIQGALYGVAVSFTAGAFKYVGKDI